jgi:hypothetical protein
MPSRQGDSAEQGRRADGERGGRDRDRYLPHEGALHMTS